MASVSGKAITFTYQVGAGHESSDLVYTATNAFTAGTHIRDEAGNDANRTLPDIATFTNNNAIKVDGIVPADFPTGTVVTVGDSVVTGYLNEDNTAIKVTVPIANDASLENGKVQIQAKIGANNYANIGSACDHNQWRFGE